MNYSSHILVGAGSLCAVLLAADLIGFSPAPEPVVLASGLGIAALGAIAADIDHPNSFISFTAPHWLFKISLRLLIFISIPAIITIASRRRFNLMEPGQLFQWNIFRLLVVVVVGVTGLFVLSRLVQGFFKHRGPIHSPAFWLGATLCTMILLAVFVRQWWWMGLLFSWGWFTHLAADGLTPRGIPLLWPLTSERFSLLPGCLLAPARLLVVIASAFSVMLLAARLIKLF